MAINQKLEELIKKALKQAEGSFAKDLSQIPTLKETLKGDEILKKEIEKIYKFLIEGKWVQEIVNDFITSSACYLVVQKFIETFKVYLLERIAIENSVPQTELEILGNRIRELENNIAKAFLKRNIHELRDVKNSKLNVYALYRAHSEYIERIIQSIEREDLSSFPLESYEKSRFKESITFPESIMACMNAYFCDYLENLEKSVYKAAKAFYILYSQRNFKEAYLAFKELKDLTLKVSHKLAELYFIAFTNGESNFIKLVDYIGKIYPKRFIAALDLANLKSLNKTLSEATVNSVLEQVDRLIRKFFQPKVRNFLAVRGITHNFLILGVNLKDSQFKETMEELYLEVEKLFKENDIKANFRIYGFLMNNKFSGLENRINNLLLFVKRRAKEEGERILVLSNDKEIEKLLDWQKEQFKKISFIREKVEGEEIDVVFQPIVESKTLKIFALEALFRVVDGSSLIPPGIFLDIINQMDLISKVDVLVLKRVLEKKELIKIITKNIFINVSPKSLSNKFFVRKLDKFIDGMEGFNIFLELTEQELLKNIEELKELVGRYGNLNIVIDDFGSGYSSFKLVIDLAENGTLKVLKLDGSYTKRAVESRFTRRAIRAISLLAKNLGIKTVAEFVENKKIAKALEIEGIDYLQGYFISKPKPIEELIYEIDQV